MVCLACMGCLVSLGCLACLVQLGCRVPGVPGQAHQAHQGVGAILGGWDSNLGWVG